MTICRIDVSADIDFTSFLRGFNTDLYEIYVPKDSEFDEESTYFLLKNLKDRKKKVCYSLKNVELLKEIKPDFVRVRNYWSFSDGVVDDILEYCATEHISTIFEVTKVNNDYFSVISYIESLYYFPEFKVEVVTTEFELDYILKHLTSLLELNSLYHNIYFRDFPSCIFSEIPTVKESLKYELNGLGGHLVPVDFFLKNFIKSNSCKNCKAFNTCPGINKRFPGEIFTHLNPLNSEIKNEDLCIYNL